jgi:Flp pilus assembly pilin Flp
VSDSGSRAMPWDHWAAEGATAVEYAIVASLIAAVIIVVVRTIGLWLPGGFQEVINFLTP